METNLIKFVTVGNVILVVSIVVGFLLLFLICKKLLTLWLDRTAQQIAWIVKMQEDANAYRQMKNTPDQQFQTDHIVTLIAKMGAKHGQVSRVYPHRFFVLPLSVEWAVFKQYPHFKYNLSYPHEGVLSLFILLIHLR